MSPSRDYNGAAFTAEAVVGLRAFTTADNRLRGVTVAYGWHPGENVAECLRDEFGYPAMIGPARSIAGCSWLPAGHPVAALNCQCGFFACYDGTNPYGDASTASATARVSGIIHAYGRVTAGSKGFRAEKARIVALIWPLTMQMGLLPDVQHGLALDQFGAICGHYRVPGYESTEAALADHPLSVPPLPAESEATA